MTGEHMSWRAPGSSLGSSTTHRQSLKRVLEQQTSCSTRRTCPSRRRMASPHLLSSRRPGSSPRSKRPSGLMDTTLGLPPARRSRACSHASALWTAPTGASFEEKETRVKRDTEGFRHRAFGGRTRFEKRSVLLFLLSIHHSAHVCALNEEQSKRLPIMLRILSTRCGRLARSGSPVSPSGIIYPLEVPHQQFVAVVLQSPAFGPFGINPHGCAVIFFGE